MGKIALRLARFLSKTIAHRIKMQAKVEILAKNIMKTKKGS